MFYVKEKVGNGCSMRTDITNENVFTNCTQCGAEVQVDLEEILSDGNGDLLSTKVVCSKCANHRKERDNP